MSWYSWEILYMLTFRIRHSSLWRLAIECHTFEYWLEIICCTIFQLITFSLRKKKSHIFSECRMEKKYQLGLYWTSKLKWTYHCRRCKHRFLLIKLAEISSANFSINISQYTIRIIVNSCFLPITRIVSFHWHAPIIVIWTIGTVQQTLSLMRWFGGKTMMYFCLCLLQINRVYASQPQSVSFSQCEPIYLIIKIWPIAGCSIIIWATAIGAWSPIVHMWPYSIHGMLIQCIVYKYNLYFHFLFSVIYE